VETQSPARTVAKPLQKVIQWLLSSSVVVAAGLIVWWVRPGTKACTVKESYGNDNICILTGTLQPIDETNKSLNAKRLGRVSLDEAKIEDATGQRVIYFDPTEYPLHPGETVSLFGRETSERGSGNRFYVVQGIK
jgi:hypothetical protein